MSSITSGLLPEGLRDRLPPQAETAATLEGRLLGVLASHGYARVAPPLVEYEESLTDRLANTDRRELLRFTDPVSQRTLALRPDITGQIARIAATRFAHAPRPLRLSYAGSVLRVRGSELNPAREMMQVGAELIGSDSVAAAVEVARLAVEALTVAGVTGLTVDLTMPDVVDTLVSRIMDSARIARLKTLLDAKDAGGMTAEGFGDWLPLLAATGPIGTALGRLRAFDHVGLLTSRLDGVEAVAAALDGVRVTLDPTERHGFEYQSWIGFSLFAPAVRGEAGRGGSYFVRHGERTGEAAVGFSVYVDGLVDAGLGVTSQRRIALPAGTPRDVGERLRGDGWTTVAALGEAMPPGCDHVWDGVEATPLPLAGGAGKTDRAPGGDSPPPAPPASGRGEHG